LKPREREQQEARKSEYEELLERKEKRGYDPG
jgi:predicted DNA-binding WGR domain protein